MNSNSTDDDNTSLGATSLSTAAVSIDSSLAPLNRTSLRAQKGWGDRSVSNILASIDRSRQNLTMHRCGRIVQDR